MIRPISRNLFSRTAGLRRVQTVALAFAVTIALAAPEAYAQKGQKPQTFNVLPVTITDVTLDATATTATSLTFNVSGLVGTNPFQVPLIVTAQENGDAECPILNLELAPIHLTLLGLNVDTSAICLRVTAMEGGGVLGDLLCSVANLLSDGLALDITGLSLQQITDLENGLLQLLNGAFDQITSSTSVVDASCNVLNLALGQIDLNLLGLVVELDNCAGGPVTVDITATPGGGLLGDLLCSLGNLLNSPGNVNQNAVLALLRQITSVIGGIVG